MRRTLVRRVFYLPYPLRYRASLHQYRYTMLFRYATFAINQMHIAVVEQRMTGIAQQS